jgi:hypothetical protein
MFGATQGTSTVRFNNTTVATVACTPASLSVNRGANGSFTCTLTRTGGFTGAVTFAASGLPAGVSASFSPASTTGNSTVVTLAAQIGGNGTAHAPAATAGR